MANEAPTEVVLRTDYQAFLRVVDATSRATAQINSVGTKVARLCLPDGTVVMIFPPDPSQADTEEWKEFLAKCDRRVHNMAWN